MNRARVLVDTARVDQHRDDIVLIECQRKQTMAYDVGHIDSALKLDWTRDLQDQVCRDLIDAPGFLERLMSRLGVANDTTVVLYGGNNNWFAAYAYWLFKLYGHDNVRRRRWPERWSRGAAATTAVPASRTTTRYVAKPNPALWAMREEVLESAGTHNLVDVRTPDEYAGRLLAPAHLPHEQARSGPATFRRDQCAVEPGGPRLTARLRRRVDFGPMIPKQVWTGPSRRSPIAESGNG